MSELETPSRETEEEYLCSCVLLFKKSGDEMVCNAYVGPDNPFCECCEDRHASDGRVLAGDVEVVARLRRKEDA
jgi:hypothetical protein